MKTPIRLAVIIAGAAFAASALAQQFVYPAKGQSPDQQKKDEGACHVWAVEQSKYDPANPPPPPQAAKAPTPAPGTPPRAGVPGAAPGGDGHDARSRWPRRGPGRRRRRSRERGREHRCGGGSGRGARAEPKAERRRRATAATAGLGAAVRRATGLPEGARRVPRRQGLFHQVGANTRTRGKGRP